MTCEKCGSKVHRDDAMNRRCNGCERLVRLCICSKPKDPKENDPADTSYLPMPEEG